ncbi:tRNA (adenine(22)-N(1))-methyltransferase [Neobacillus dielmonensis]|uniref:tRNA (adenine(22)-N(1))-methyltransferase n=1 Tax=Neobacillus dielmonensis TaxID=1347369 RepID=UPI0005AA81F0|nr:tRNA (adenine(22)-N(1))-methyltransferase TrmK [Neobacillus dielmonensis]
MNSEKLSARLNTVAKYVAKGARLADIGSDHAYLPCYLAKNNEIVFAIAGEVAVGPYQSAQRHVVAEGLSEVISVRLGDGLEVIQPGEVDCITIAGMGGALITSILEKGKEKLGSVTRLILQPNISAETIRKWLIENGWELIAEEILEEDGKIYEVLTAEKGNVLRPYRGNLELGVLVGPYLVENQTNAFYKKWTAEIDNWQRILMQLNEAVQTPETLDKKRELTNKIHLVKEALKNENA